MRRQPFIIFGAGGHAKVTIEAALTRQLKPLWVVDDNPKCKKLLGIKIRLAEDGWFRKLNCFRFLVGIGDTKIRRSIFKRLRKNGGTPAAIVHKHAFVSAFAIIGDGTLVCAGAIIQPGAVVGENCIINTSSSLDHDCSIGDHSHIGPGVRLAGEVTMGESVFLGTGAMVLPRIRIGARSIIGAGAMVNRDIPGGVVAYGNPVRVIRAAE